MRISNLLTSSLVLAGTFAAGLVQAEATGGRWYLDSCPQKNRTKAETVRSEILSAAPGSSVFVPRPFPVTDEQVIENLEYQFLDLFSQDSPKEVPDDVRGVLQALQRKSARFEVLSVTVWRADRCGPVYGQTDFVFLVRVYSTGQEKELARVIINDTGLMATFAIADAAAVGRKGDFRAIDSIEELRATNRTAAGASDFQFVSLSGFGMRCSEKMPCIAFRDSKRAYFSKGGKVYALELDRPGVAGVRSEDVGSETPQRAAATSALRPGEHLVTVGSNMLAVASPVPE